jgi:hypothetical protein
MLLYVAIAQGKCLPHPFPELLAFGETGEPTLKRSGKLAPNEKEN